MIFKAVSTCYHAYSSYLLTFRSGLGKASSGASTLIDLDSLVLQTRCIQSTCSNFQHFLKSSLKLKVHFFHLDHIL